MSPVGGGTARSVCISLLFNALRHVCAPRPRGSCGAETVDGSRRSGVRAAVRSRRVPPAPHSNPITAVKWDYVSSNVMIEHNGGALAGKYTNTVSDSTRRCVA